MKKLLALLLSVVLVLSLAACGGSASSAPAADAGDSAPAAAPAGDSKGTIGILMPTLSAEFFVSTANSLAATVEAAGYTANIQSFEMDAGQAVTVIENFITDGVVGIAYMTVDAAGDDALKEAMDAGIAVLTCGVENENYDVCQIVDNYATGYMIGEMAADYINTNLGGEAQVAYVTSTRSQNMMDRVAGYRAAMQDLCPGAEIVYENECVNAGEGSSYAENLNTLYPDCKIVLSYSDTFVKEISEVWNALSYDKTAAAFGHDGETPVLADIAANGYSKGTIILGDSGVTMGEGIVAYLNGEYESHTLVTLPGTAVTPENISEFYAG